MTTDAVQINTNNNTNHNNNNYDNDDMIEVKSKVVGCSTEMSMCVT